MHIKISRFGMPNQRNVSHDYFIRNTNGNTGLHGAVIEGLGGWKNAKEYFNNIQAVGMEATVFRRSLNDLEGFCRRNMSLIIPKLHVDAARRETSIVEMLNFEYELRKLQPREIEECIYLGVPNTFIYEYIGRYCIMETANAYNHLVWS